MEIARVQAGLKLGDLEAHSLPQGWELRFHPSTRRTATIGGFIAGGSGGVGSVQFGGLRSHGNVLGLRVITMEEKPRVLELRGEEVMQAIHAYGTNGIITELEIPLARSWPWHEAIVAFDDIGRAASFGNALGEADGITKKLISIFDWGWRRSISKPLLSHLPAGQAIALCLIADPSREAFAMLANDSGGRIVFERAAGGDGGEIPPLYEFTWNHTTLWALKADRTITYLQCPVRRAGLSRQDRPRRRDCSATKRRCIWNSRASVAMSRPLVSSSCASRTSNDSTRSLPGWRRRVAQ